MDKEQIKEPPSLVTNGALSTPSAPTGSHSELPPNLANGLEHKSDSQETIHTMTTSSLVERLNQIEADIIEVKFIIRNQKLLNEEYVELVKEIINQQAVSPHIGSNSPKPGSTFCFKRRNKQRRYGSIPALKGETTRGRRKLFLSGSISGVGRSKGEKIYITSSSIPAVQYAEQQNFLQIRHVNRSQWGRESGKNILHGMPLTFFPTKDIKIVSLDLFAAAYIFNTKLDQDELLVKSPHCAVTRGALRSLEPRKPVVDDVLILFACMLARNSTRIHWFLPTTFSQIATERGSVPHATLKAIREDLMGKANRVCKIYCPIWCDRHWFLLVIDVIRRELVYPDSLPSVDDRPMRLRQLKKVAIFLGEMLDSDDWYDDQKNPRILCSDYEIKEPKVTRQDLGSNDCGMYVVQWMIMYHLWNSYEVEKITEYSRMRLAVDMVLKYHNDKCMEVIQAVLEY
ncbi:hypothetical protein HN51_031020 [Arachis hypogaea]